MTLFSWLLNGGSGTTISDQSSSSSSKHLTKSSSKHVSNQVVLDSDIQDESESESESDSDSSSLEDNDYNDNDSIYRVKLLESISVSPLKLQNYMTIPRDNSTIPLEMVFSFDTTGRMFKFFERMKTTPFKDSLFRLFEMIPLLRIAIIAHGDYCDDNTETSHPYKCAISILPFTNDCNEIIEFINKVEKTDGGDAPESYEYVLRKSRELPWSTNSKKAIVLFGDDVPHPPSYTDQHLYWRNELHFLTKIGVRMYGVQLNLTNFIAPKLNSLIPTNSNTTSSSSTFSTTTIPTITTKTTISNRQQQQQQQSSNMFLFDTTPLIFNTSSIDSTPASTPMTPYASYRQYPQLNSVRRQPISTPIASNISRPNINISNNPLIRRQLKIGVVASPKQNLTTTTTAAASKTTANKITTPNKQTNSSKKRKSFESEEDEQEEEDNSSISTQSSDEFITRDLFGQSTATLVDSNSSSVDNLNQQGSLLANHQHTKELLFLEKPPKPIISQARQSPSSSSSPSSAASTSSLMATQPTTAAAVTSTTTTSTTTTTSLFTVNNNHNNNHQHHHQIQQQQQHQSPTKNRGAPLELSPPKIGNFIALRTATGHDFVVGKVLGYSSKDPSDPKLKSVDVVRYQCVEDDDDRYYIEGKKQTYQIDAILGNITMKNDTASNQYRLILPNPTAPSNTTQSTLSIRKMMKLLFVTIVLGLLFQVSFGTETAKFNGTVEERVRKELEVWENNWSGFPINCRRMVDTLSADGVIEYPAGKNVIGGGHKRIFSRCEKFIIENFNQMQTYITGPAHVVGYNAAFERTTLFMTKNNCRLYSRGIVTIQYDKDFKIKVLKDFFDADELVAKYQSCQFPDTPLPDHMAGAEDTKVEEVKVEEVKVIKNEEKSVKDEL
ncbi:hypothetical protein PPL_01204 [Heterostelium album PN500]|uniref:Uncharacterized protein n=1 Tax=Heterostelium pallidum (strain ATCC 26659 / Pp 5 / PN500) TaxID=670386 RepID=D3AYE4_HETP5|nr:hypothetical protein PPL_01204 [Heterostelium album PN500]EFA85971.1 hypothetical protein PPL_01204 [Heterostelium album PN500]|eukprot:XP_020438077.1 hypothetical protein PPL_01204 [Heterostelium album PN500]